MRTSFFAIALALAGALASGCSADESEICPATSLEVRANSTGPVERTGYVCSGEVAQIQTCDEPLLAAADQHGCGDLRITLGAKTGGGKIAVLYLEFDGDRLSRARAQIHKITDVITDTPPVPSDSVGGWLAVDVASPDPSQRNAGRFRLEFEEGVIEGAYDTSNSITVGTFVADSLTVGSTPEQAESLAMDLDGDGTPDNVFGRFLTSLPFDDAGSYQGWVAQLIADGEIVPLFSVLVATRMTGSFEDAWRSFLGMPSPRGGLQINDQFPGGTVAGITRESRFEGPVAPASSNDYVLLHVALLEGTGPVRLALPLARVQADVTETNVRNGKLGGGIHINLIDTVVIPALAESFARAVDADCVGGICTPGSSGEALLAGFDEDGDDAITVDELLTGAALASALAPDLDLSGTGSLDGVSFGFQFSAVRAEFDVPYPDNR